MTRLAILLALLTTSVALTAQAQSPIAGDWQGGIDTPAGTLHLVLHITDNPLKATFDSPDQGAHGLPIASTTFADNTLTLDVAIAHASYKATLSPDHNTLTGDWTQGQSIPLTLKRSTAAAVAALEPRRPQNPTKPYPYQSIDLTYPNKLQGDTLAATLTIPPGKGPFPAVLLITGSGAQDRDEAIMGHKPFLVLSDFLTRHGIIVLRADDRGTAKSTGNFATATTADFATDAEAGIAFLKTRPEVDPKKIGLIGHSEGGIIAPMVAARNKDVAFIVLLAGSGLPGSEIIAQQVALMNKASGASEADLQAADQTERKLLAIAVKDEPAEARAKEFRTELGDQMPAAQIDAAIAQLNSPWFHFFLTYDPAPALGQLKIPVLALDGSKDLQVPPEANLAAIKAALTAAGNTHFEIVEFPNLNHLFQTATTGLPTEYATIEETIAPVVLNKISTWILQR